MRGFYLGLASTLRSTAAALGGPSTPEGAWRLALAAKFEAHAAAVRS